MVVPTLSFARVHINRFNVTFDTRPKLPGLNAPLLVYGLCSIEQKKSPRREGQDTTELAIKAIDENYANI